MGNGCGVAGAAPATLFKSGQLISGFLLCLITVITIGPIFEDSV